MKIHITQTEACLDAQVPKWQDDRWYWSKEAKDRGCTRAPDDQQYLHPEYAPVHRYATDIIGCLNNFIPWHILANSCGPAL